MSATLKVPQTRQILVKSIKEICLIGDGCAEVVIQKNTGDLETKTVIDGMKEQEIRRDNLLNQYYYDDSDARLHTFRT